MKHIIKLFAVLVAVFVFKASAAFAICDKAYNTNLPEDYEWYLVSSKVPASKILTGSSTKTFQFCKQDGDTITLSLNNYKDGSSVFRIVSVKMDLKVTLTLGKDNVAKLLSEEDPRLGYYDGIKLYVEKGKMYMGFFVKPQ